MRFYKLTHPEYDTDHEALRRNPAAIGARYWLTQADNVNVEGFVFLSDRGLVGFDQVGQPVFKRGHPVARGEEKGVQHMEDRRLFFRTEMMSVKFNLHLNLNPAHSSFWGSAGLGLSPIASRHGSKAY